MKTNSRQWSAITLLMLVVLAGIIVVPQRTRAAEPWNVARRGSDNSDPLTTTQIFVPLVARNYCPLVYADDYSDPGSGWPVGDDGIARWEYLNGEYRILVRDIGYWAGARAPSLKVSDYVLVVDARSTVGVGATGSSGLLFGLSDDWSQFYFFEVQPSGSYAIFRYSSDTWTTLAQGLSSSINTGMATNRLNIERNGALIRAYVNEQLLTTVSDSSYTGLRRVGLIAMTYAYGTPNMDVRFDNFAVYACGAIATTLGATSEKSDWPLAEMDQSVPVATDWWLRKDDIESETK